MVEVVEVVGWRRWWTSLHMFGVGSSCLANLGGAAGTGRLQNGIHAVFGVDGWRVGGVEPGGKNNVVGWLEGRGDKCIGNSSSGKTLQGGQASQAGVEQQGGLTDGVPAGRHDLQLSHLLLSDLVIAVRYQILPHFGQSKSNPRMGLGWGSKGCDFHVEIFLQMLILGILRGS